MLLLYVADSDIKSILINLEYVPYTPYTVSKYVVQ